MSISAYATKPATIKKVFTPTYCRTRFVRVRWFSLNKKPPNAGDSSSLAVVKSSL